MRKFILLLFLPLILSAQQKDFKLIDVPGNTRYFSAIELSPDGKTLALCAEDDEIIFFDLNSKTVLRKIPIEGFYFDMHLCFSANGKYLLIDEQNSNNIYANKTYPTHAAVMEVASGQLLLKEDNVRYAEFDNNTENVVLLKNGEIKFVNIKTGVVEKSFRPDQVANAFSVCDDGNHIAVAQKPASSDLDNFPTLRNDKKMEKAASKYNQIISFYDTKTFTRKFIASEIFDIVFSMKYNSNANMLYVFNAPNLQNKATAAAHRNGYIQIVDPQNGQVSRTSFSTRETEPTYKESADGKYLATTSIEHKNKVINSIIVYNSKTAETIDLFQIDFRTMEGGKGLRTSFDFMPDHKSIVFGYGTKLAVWEFEKN